MPFMCSNRKGGVWERATVICKRDPKANISMKMGIGESFTVRNFIICTVHLI
jgi:hypothetical protein